MSWGLLENTWIGRHCLLFPTTLKWNIYPRSPTKPFLVKYAGNCWYERQVINIDQLYSKYKSSPFQWVPPLLYDVRQLLPQEVGVDNCARSKYRHRKGAEKPSSVCAPQARCSLPDKPEGSPIHSQLHINSQHKHNDINQANFNISLKRTVQNEILALNLSCLDLSSFTSCLHWI